MRWLLRRVRSTEWLPLLCMYVRCFLGALSAALMQVAPEDVHGANGPPDAPPLTLFLGVDPTLFAPFPPPLWPMRVTADDMGSLTQKG